MFAKEGTLRLRACSLDMQCDTPQPTPGRSFRKLTMYHVCVKFYLRCSGVDLANCTFILHFLFHFFFFGEFEVADCVGYPCIHFLAHKDLILRKDFAHF